MKYQIILKMISIGIEAVFAEIYKKMSFLLVLCLSLIVILIPHFDLDWEISKRMPIK